MGDNGHTFGIFTKKQKGVTFGGIRARVVDDSHPNHPSNLESPNYPRSDGRFPGYQNPILGDEGKGKIGRWQELKLDALENIVDQIIEQYLKDRSWYSSVRCREALWNMYRRIQKWVNQQIDPTKNQYQRALQLIKDCIYNILDPKEDELMFLEVDHSEGKSPDLEYTSEWVHENAYIMANIENKPIQTIKTSSKFQNAGYLYFNYSINISNGNDRAYLKVNGEEVWSVSGNFGENSFRDFRYFVEPGAYQLEWGVTSNYGRSILKIKDIFLAEFQPQNERTHGTHAGIEVPYCPAPYYHHFNADYFNHFDGSIYKRVLFSMKEFPKLNSFPGFFRYVSSTEDQEWELVYSVGQNEETGSENILKVDLSKLKVGNSSKVTFNWRFKKRGVIKFKYLTSVEHGNGLMFFINGNQVGGQWSREKEWKEVSFNVMPGQTYKFDWLVRRLKAEVWGFNAIYLKDIECIEIIDTVDRPTPLDYDTLGPDGIADSDYQWSTHSESSVVRTNFDGIANSENFSRELIMDLHNECDGSVTFKYQIGAGEPNPKEEYFLLYEEEFRSRNTQKNGKHGSSVRSNIPQVWELKGDKAVTTAHDGKIEYDLTVGEDSTLYVQGSLNIKCPPRIIDHHVPQVVANVDMPFNYSGVNQWRREPNRLVMSDPIVQGYGEAYTNVYLEDGGWFTFGLNHELRNTEYFEVHVNGERVFYSDGYRNVSNIRIPLFRGNNRVSFLLFDSFTEPHIYDEFAHRFSYGAGSKGKTYSFYSQFNSSVSIVRNWDVTNASTHTSENGASHTYEIELNPGATFQYDELLTLHPSLAEDNGTLILEEYFNDQDVYDSRITMSTNWEWEDILTRYSRGSGDGVYKVEGKPGTVNTITAISNLASNQSGVVGFEYGGAMGRYENLELYADSSLIWSGNRATSTPKGETIRVPLPKGTSQVEWVYKDMSGEEIREGHDYNDNVVEEECFPSGSYTHDLGYGNAGRSTTARRTEYSWGGKDDTHYGNYAQGSSINGGYVVRNIVNPSYVNTVFRETIRIYAGTGAPMSGLNPTNTKFMGIQKSTRILRDYHNYSAITVALPVEPGRPSPGNSAWAVNQFRTNGQIDTEIEYLSYIYATGSRHGRKTSLQLRAVFYTYLAPVPTNWDGSLEQLYAHRSNWELMEERRENVGRKQRFDQITDWTGSRKIRIQKSVPPGEYLIILQMLDKVVDSNRDSEGYYYYVAFKNNKLNVTDSNRINQELDDTRVRVELINQATGAVVQNQTLYGRNGTNGVLEVTPSFNIPPGSYQVKYTLLKGNGTTGGLSNQGGAFSALRAEFEEYVSPYCKDNFGNYYRQGHPPIDRRRGDGTTITVPPSNSNWVWIDAIKIYAQNKGTCSGTQVRARVYDEGDLFYNHVFSFDDERVFVEFQNTTHRKRRYKMTLTFEQGCPGDGALLTDGGVRIVENIPPTSSYVEVTNFEAVNNRPVWMGGCYNSEAYVTLRDEVGRLVYSNTFTPEGLRSFSVSSLSHLPYSKYKVTIEVRQGGEISPVTGKRYYTEFELLDFRVFEYWVWTPEPFRGTLRFYIGDTLIDTYMEQGEDIVSYPVPAGNKKLRWVFESQRGNNVWDFAEIDWLRLTNWICDKVLVTPYCEKGEGDKCIEALIKCLISIYKSRPKMCVIGKRIWLFT